MKKFSVVISVILIVCCLFGFAACDLVNAESKTENVQNSSSVGEQLYLEAVAAGYAGTLEEYLVSLQGASAYDIAVKNGFSGTETEWLESLKGEKGDAGEKGEDGKDGENGADGKDAVQTVYGVYEEAVKNGFSGTFSEFLEKYLTLSAEQGVNADNLFSSVSVLCAFSVTQYSYSMRYGLVPQTVTATSAGSGVIYSVNKDIGEAYVVTNYHVVYNSGSTTGVSEHIYVYLYGSEIIGSEFYSEELYGNNALTEQGMGIEATYVGGSMYYDIAVLKITDERLKEDKIKAVTFADSNEISVSDVAYAVGNAEGEGISVTKGVVSVDSENITMAASDGKSSTTFRVMRIDTAVNSGNSGGGLFGSDGLLIGIVNAKTTEEGVENISYALPSNVVKYIVENILDYKDDENKASDVRKCMLGVTVSTQESSAVLADDGRVRIVEKVVVSSVKEDSLASGKLQEGDVLISATISRAGEEDETYPITRSFIIVDLMLTLRVGDTLTLTSQRDGATQTTEFVMTEECISEIG